MYSDPVLSLAPASATQRIEPQRDPQPSFQHEFAVLGHLGSIFFNLAKYPIGVVFFLIFMGIFF